MVIASHPVVCISVATNELYPFREENQSQKNQEDSPGRRKSLAIFGILSILVSELPRKGSKKCRCFRIPFFCF